MQLTVQNLEVSYGKIKALHGLNFSIDQGEIVCIIGANGAGKSTTLRAISRMVDADPGSEMTFMSQDLLNFAPDKVVSQLGISHVPEGRRLFGNLTVMENLQLATLPVKTKRISKATSTGFSVSFHACRSAKNRPPAPSAAVNSKCWP